MAEPNTEELKTVRFNMFMTPSEMKAIEEWCWENRIRSRSEGIRRLIEIGLKAEALGDMWNEPWEFMGVVDG